MASKSHSEFEYRYQVNGQTIWEKIKILTGFLEGRVRAAKLEEVGLKRYQAKIAKLEYLKNTISLQHEILELEADILEADSFADEAKILYALNIEEIEILKRLIAEALVIAEPTRIFGHSNEQMFDANAVNEYTAVIGREIQAELIAHGHASAAKISMAMSNPITWNALIAAGLIPAGNTLLSLSNDPQKVEVSIIPLALENK